MIVSHKHRFIFIKTKKTAGTSIEVALSKIAGDDAIVTPIGKPEPGHEPRNFHGGLGDSLRWVRAHPAGPGQALARVLRHPRGREHRHYFNHMPAWMVRAHVGREVWDGYFKFCFERNPWDKVASLYWWLASKTKSPPPFEDWLFNDPVVVSDWPIYAVGDELIVDAVGRYENLRSDLDAFLKRTGASTDGLTLPHAKSGVRGQQGLFSSRAAEHVRRLFHREIAAFGYEFPEELRAHS